MTVRCLRLVASASTTTAGVAKFSDDNPSSRTVDRSSFGRPTPAPRITVGVKVSQIDCFVAGPRELRRGRLVAA